MKANKYRIFDLLRNLRELDVEPELVDRELEHLYERCPELKPGEDDNQVGTRDAYSFLQSPIKADELLSLASDEVVRKLVTLDNPDLQHFISIQLSREIRQAIATEPGKAVEWLKAFEEHDDRSTAYWDSIFLGWLEASTSEEQWSELLVFLTQVKHTASSVDHMAMFLDYSVSGASNLLPYGCKELARHLALTVWRNLIAVDDEITPHEDGWFETAFRHSGGKIMHFMLRIMATDYEHNGRRWDKVSRDYLPYFDKVVSSDSTAAETARVMLMTDLRFFAVVERDWVLRKLIPLLDWNSDQRRASQVWSGYLKCSPLPADILHRVLPYYQQTFSELAEYPARALDDVVRHVTIICLSINPMDRDWLLGFVKAAPLQAVVRWVEFITREFSTLSDEEAHLLWDKWLKAYWERRLAGEPKPMSEDELKSMCSWCTVLHSLWPEITDMLIHGSVPTHKHLRIYREIAEGNYASQFPDQVAKLVSYLLGGARSPFADCEEVTQIVRQMHKAGVAKDKLSQVCNQMSSAGCANGFELAQSIGVV